MYKHNYTKNMSLKHNNNRNIDMLLGRLQLISEVQLNIKNEKSKKNCLYNL